MTRIENREWKKYKDFYHYDDKDGHIVIHEDAPDQMMESYEAYQKEINAASQRGTL